MSLRAYQITGIDWDRPPERVEPGEEFDLIVRVFGDDDSETQGEPITFFINGEEFMTTSGADIPPGDFAFDGLVDVTFEETGTYKIEAGVGDYRTEPHFLGVGEDPDPDAVDGAGVNAGLVVGGLIGLEALRRIFT